MLKKALARLLAPPRTVSRQEMATLVVLSGGSYAGFSFLGLFFVTHFLGAEAGGIFGLALTLSQQVLTIGWFAARRFQASDCHEKFTFSDYLGTRLVTTTLMILVGTFWSFAGGFSHEKQLAILLLVALKASEAFSDVLAGRYQQKNRFDVSCRILLVKTLLSLGAFVLPLGLGATLPLALGSMLFTHLLLTILLDGSVLPLFSENRCRPTFTHTPSLLSACFPLFVTSFLTTYLNGAPKYVIDRMLGEHDTAIFCALSMASLAILLLSEFLINPQIARLSLLRAQGKHALFRASLSRLFFLLLGSGALGLATVYAIGIPILSLLFHLNLTPHRTLLCLLFTGGIFLALSQLFQLILILFRQQMWCLPGILIASLTALFSMPPLVQHSGLLGGGIGFLLSLATMAICHAIAALLLLFSRKQTPCT